MAFSSSLEVIDSKSNITCFDLIKKSEIRSAHWRERDVILLTVQLLVVKLEIHTNSSDTNSSDRPLVLQAE